MTREPRPDHPSTSTDGVAGGGRDNLQDVGPEVIEFVSSVLEIDPQWSVHESRRFTWWAGRLAQRVWADPMQVRAGAPVVRMHAETALARQVPQGFESRQRLAALNRFASLSALVLEADGGRVRLHSTVTVHPGNVGLARRLFLGAVIQQVADAHIKADDLVPRLEGEVDASGHPRSGARPEPHEILGALATIFGPGGQDPSPFTTADFEAALAMTPRPWVLATGGGPGLTAEFPFTGPAPATTADWLQTALLVATAEERHPQLGSGALVRLSLPLALDADTAVTLADELNRAEATDWTDTHLLGAWCHRKPEGLTFVTFVPAVLHRTGPLDHMVLSMARRTEWVRGWLADRGRLEGGGTIDKADGTNDRDPAVSGRPAPRVRAATEVRCWRCRQILLVTAETRGRKVRCPGCGTRQALPA